MIDSALLRPGRFDFVIELPIPDEKTRLRIFEIHTQGKPIAKDVDLSILAKETDGITGAEIEAICTGASMNAIREFLGSKTEDHSSLRIRKIHFRKSLETWTKS
jgi:transitional endoplasmic reticulum ATPase